MSNLPVAGKDGTLVNRLKHTNHHIIAKTGNVKGISGLAGYIDPGTQQAKSFVILLSGNKNTQRTLKVIESELLKLISELEA